MEIALLPQITVTSLHAVHYIVLNVFIDEAFPDRMEYTPSGKVCAR